MTERDPLVLIQESLTEDETRQFLAEAVRRWPRMNGARAADVLEHTTEYDLFLSQTEPFYAVHGGHLVGVRGVTPALHLLILLGRELTMANLTAVLTAAGLMKPRTPAFPELAPGDVVRLIVPDGEPAPWAHQLPRHGTGKILPVQPGDYWDVSAREIDEGPQS